MGGDLREAVLELRGYLSDRLAPLMVAESLGMLLEHPAPVMASEIQAWVGQQRVGSQGTTSADLLFHAVKKIFQMGEFELVPKDFLRKYIADLSAAVLTYCPDAERDVLRQNLDRLGEAPMEESAGAVEVMHIQGSGPAGAAAPAAAAPKKGPALPPDVIQGLNRLSLFLERLTPQAPAEQRTEVASRFMTEAAVRSQTVTELDEQLARLKLVGIDATTDQVFKTLAASLPGWGSLPTKPGAPPAPKSAQASAMQRIVTLAGDPADVAKRFREMVHSAVEQFNQGHLGRAVTIFEVAEQLVADQKVQVVFVDTMRKSGHEYLDAERVKKLSERTESRPGFRTVLNFFFATQPQGLLKSLDGEPRRERRHELLALLEVHGPAARAKAVELLRASVEQKEPKVDPFFQMNLVYLMRVIPRPEDSPVETEVNLIMKVTGRDSPPPLVKQVIAYLAQTKNDKAERALITYLRVFENMLLQPETAVYDTAEIETLLERTCAGLARYGSPRAWRALVDHGLKVETRLGSTAARLAEAGKQDFSGSKDLLKRMLDALKDAQPRSVLGFTVNKNDGRIISLIQALGGTPTPEVKAALQEIVKKNPGEKFAEEAKKVLQSMATPAKPQEAAAAGLSGDLELFGLPGVLQTLSNSALTGVLSLLSPQGKVEATLQLQQGLFRAAQAGRLKGEDAVYQLFIRPFPGTFSFTSQKAAPDPKKPGVDFMGLILEGVRRHDEFKQAAALVSDTAALDPTGSAHTPLPDEEAPFVEQVWGHVAPGRTVAECEALIAADSFRTRRLLAHWVEEGALKVR